MENAGFVEIPVPLEILPQVKSYVKWNLSIERNQLENENAIAEALDLCDGELLALARLLATTSLELEELTLQSAAERLQTSPRYLQGMIANLNYLVAQRDGPQALIFRKRNHYVAEEAGDEWASAVLVMPTAFAELVKEALA